MSPRRRRRARRRSPARPFIVLGISAIGLLLLVGGLAEVSSQSNANANANRSLAALGGVVAEQSDTTSAQIRSLLTDLPTQIRQTLQADLDGAVNATSTEARRAELASGSAAPGSVGGNFAAVFRDRANAASELRSAVYGFLGMHSSQVAGAPPDASPTASPVLLSATDTTNRIVAAGALFTQADQLYASVRYALAAAPGHARLPRSVWVTEPQLWQAGAVATEIDQVATSSTLLGTHYLVLRTVRLSPPALPTPQATPAGTSVLSPTTGLAVTVVIANEGTLDEPHATVRFTLANSSSGATATHAESAAVAFGASITLPDSTFVVAPGSSYVLTVSIELPNGQTDTLGTATQQTLEIAPAT